MNAFIIVFFMDSTYKTNRHRLPLLDIVGVTCIGMTFSAAFVYLKAEHENNFVWELERCRGLFHIFDGLRKLVVIDRDLALLNAMKIVFPKSDNLLFQFHINENVKASANNM